MEKHPWANSIVRNSEKFGLVIEKISGALCVICFAAMTVVAILGVFFRYVMQSPFMWTEEVARYLLVWMGFTAVSIALRQDKHIKVEVLPKLIPSTVVNKVMGYVVDALIAFFFIVLLKQGYLMTVNNIMMASTFQLSMSWILIAVPVAAALTLIQLFLNVVKRIFSGVEPKPESVA
jgi:TRAP-type C4-dicarboxylate transport system permease small subunit